MNNMISLDTIRQSGIKVMALLGLTLITYGCTIPGAVAPSTLPLPERYVTLGGVETSSSCGYSLLVFSLWNPMPMSDLINDMVKAKGGDALIAVDSSSYNLWYVVGIANCFEVHGQVVKFSR